MNDDNIAVLEGGNLPLQVTQQDEAAVSATLILKEQTTGIIVQKTAPYVDGIADVSLTGDETQDEGVYDYQINENFLQGSPDKYPNPATCIGEFSFPTITIYNALDEPS